MRLTDLKPEFRPAEGSELAEQYARERTPNMPRHMGVAFTCPCGGHEVWIPFANAEDDGFGAPKWTATQDESLETLTIAPSILDRGCGAHYFVRNGEIINT